MPFQNKLKILQTDSVAFLIRNLKTKRNPKIKRSQRAENPISKNPIINLNQRTILSPRKIMKTITITPIPLAQKITKKIIRLIRA